MSHKKSLQELTFKDNFMFGAVLLDPENCKGILERTIGTKIERVEVSKEKSIVYNPEYKGIRLDAYAKDENQTRYNVEMQVLQKPALQKRTRYYHGQIDMEILLTGVGYEELPDTYVIFICDFDPFHKGKYRYTKQTICKEVPELEMDDGAHTIFLSTKGTNEGEVPEELVKFLKFVGAKPSDSEKDFEDAFIKRLQKSIREVKASREMGARYMTFQELLKDERAAGKAEGKAEEVLEFLQELGTVSNDLKMCIMTETDLERLKKWVKLAARSTSLDEFINKMKE
ncbi:MAG: Rpn family recombination-promoting nuclease/putative transposase [Tyzzerella sp.]|nr:Rpn family recombination-promoting nuclease/putative transposase [Tyzzerella sp.]